MSFLHDKDITKVDEDASSDEKLVDRYRKHLANMLGVKQVDLGVDEFLTFSKFYKEYVAKATASRSTRQNRSKRD